MPRSPSWRPPTSRSWDKGVLTDLCLTRVLTDLCLTLYIIFHRLIDNSPPSVHTLSQIHSVHTHIFYSFKIRFSVDRLLWNFVFKYVIYVVWVVNELVRNTDGIILQGNPEGLRRKSCLVPLGPIKASHILTRDLTWSSAEGGRRLTACLPEVRRGSCRASYTSAGNRKYKYSVNILCVT